MNDTQPELALLIAVRATLLGLVGALELYLERRYGWKSKRVN